jgi:protein-tyrosine phosphatase
MYYAFVYAARFFEVTCIFTFSMKILFVCLGNICRSPLAEAIFNHKIQNKSLADTFFTDSCGTANYHVGDWPDHRTIKNAQKNRVEINHVGRQLSVNDLEVFDLILPMDQSNLENILRLPNATAHQHKIKLVRSFDPHGAGDVPDPYYGTEKDFQEVFEILSRTIENLISNLIKA